MKIAERLPTLQDTNDPGGALRALRAQRGWTLQELSKRTGMPISTLSKVETNKMSLTYDKMIRIATGLNIDIGVLFAAPVQTETPSAAPLTSGRRSITRAGEGHLIETDSVIQHYPAADLLGKQLVPIFVEVKARSRPEFGKLLRHPGEEFVVVLEGVLELHTEFYAPARLSKGDSIYFDSMMAHGYIAGSDEPCRIMSINATVGWGSEDEQIAPNAPPSDIVRLVNKRH
ncbi:MAG: helix-turn-helix domain-containing protein [Sphingomonas sp.]